MAWFVFFIKYWIHIYTPLLIIGLYACIINKLFGDNKNNKYLCRRKINDGLYKQRFTLYVYDTYSHCLIIYCYDSFASPVYISKEQVFMLCSAVRYLRSAVGNVHSAVVNVHSAMRNINQTRCKDTLKQGIMQTSIRLFLYIYNYLKDSISLAIIIFIRARAHYIIFNFFCHFCHLIN